MTACCPMCQGPLSVPDLEELIRTRRIKGHAAAILRAVWEAGGKAVQTERIFDAMYADDIDGGPSHTQMYIALGRARRALTAALAGTGVAVVGLGHGHGSARGSWRLKITGT